MKDLKLTIAFDKDVKICVGVVPMSTLSWYHVGVISTSKPTSLKIETYRRRSLVRHPWTNSTSNFLTFCSRIGLTRGNGMRRQRRAMTLECDEWICKPERNVKEHDFYCCRKRSSYFNTVRPPVENLESDLLDELGFATASKLSTVSPATHCSNEFASSMSYNHLNKIYHKLQTIFNFHEIITCKIKKKISFGAAEYISTKMKTLLENRTIDRLPWRAILKKTSQPNRAI